MHLPVFRLFHLLHYCDYTVSKRILLVNVLDPVLVFITENGYIQYIKISLKFQTSSCVSSFFGIVVGASGWLQQPFGLSTLYGASGLTWALINSRDRPRSHARLLPSPRPDRSAKGRMPIPDSDSK